MNVSLSRFRQELLGYLPVRLRFALRYMAQHKQFSLLIFPTTFTEKLMLRIALDRREIMRVAADKLRMREYVAERLGQKYLPKLIAVVHEAEGIRWSELPQRIVIKANHGSGWVKVVLDKSLESEEEIERHCRQWLSSDYGAFSREWAYRGIKPCIMIEEFIESEYRSDTRSNNVPYDFRCYVFNGKCAMILVDAGIPPHRTRSLYYPDWRLMDCQLYYPLIPGGVERPPFLEQLIKLVEKVGADIDFVRVDVYAGTTGLFVGELTMTPAGGTQKFSNAGIDRYLGSLWRMPNL